MVLYTYILVYTHVPIFIVTWCYQLSCIYVCIPTYIIVSGAISYHTYVPIFIVSGAISDHTHVPHYSIRRFQRSYIYTYIIDSGAISDHAYVRKLYSVRCAQGSNDPCVILLCIRTLKIVPLISTIVKIN